MDSTLTALILGALEGLTEFIPVSSTGHLLLAGRFLGFESAGHTFEVVIQLGSILALFSVYATKIAQVFSAARHEEWARRAIISLGLAFLPSVFVGVLLYRIIKEVFFETPLLIAVMLILGGIVLLVVDRYAARVARHDDAFAIPYGKSLAIGFCQCLAMVPGVSRSGATIVGAMLMGVDKRAAAEFSFLLSMPTMMAAVAYDIYKNRDVLSFDDWSNILIGFVTAFVVSVLVVRWLLDFVSRHGYAAFGWWRIIVGLLALGGLLLSA